MNERPVRRVWIVFDCGLHGVPPDQPAPRAGKFVHLLPSVLIGLPLFSAVQMLRAEPLRLGLLLLLSTFIAFLGAAWETWRSAGPRPGYTYLSNGQISRMASRLLRR
jgi:hypothetical protein